MNIYSNACYPILDDEWNDKGALTLLPQLVQPSDPILLSRLPPVSVLYAQATTVAKRARSQAILGASLELAVDTALPPPEPEPEPIKDDVTGSPTRPGRQSSTSFRTSGPRSTKSQPVKRDIQFWELLRAIERKDFTTIFAVRDHNFPMLLRKEGGVTPLIHSMRLGKSHGDITILLTGALSRWVNSLPSDTPPDKATQATLRGLQSNLKLAVNYSLASSQTELLSSYLQVIVMSEGDKWIRETSQAVGLALRSGPSAKPVATALQAIRSFATAELRNLSRIDAIASLDDFIGNATNDLICMGLWGVITDTLPGEALPLYAFARDDRIFKMFADRIHQVANTTAYRRLSKQLRLQVATVIAILETRAIGHREKAARLGEKLDQPG